MLNGANVIQTFTMWRLNLQEVDWEVELAFVIGRKGKHIKVVKVSCISPSVDICILKSKCSVSLLIIFTVLNTTCVILAAIAGHNHI